MTKLKTIIKMAKLGYKLGYNYPLSKRKKKKEKEKEKTWLQLMAATLTKKFNMTIILKFLP